MKDPIIFDAAIWIPDGAIEGIDVNKASTPVDHVSPRRHLFRGGGHVADQRLFRHSEIRQSQIF